MALPSGTSEGEKGSRGPVVRSLHALALVAFGYPYIFVTLPLLIFLLAHVIRSFFLGEAADHPWSFAGLLHCGACLAGIIVFGFLAVGHLLIVIMQGLKRDD